MPFFVYDMRARSAIRLGLSTRFSLSMENGQADAGQGGQTRLARPNSQGRTGIGKNIFPV